jgi:hypothetical protein
MTPPAPPRPDLGLLKVKDVATMLNVSVRTVYELIYSEVLDRKDIGPRGSKKPALRITVGSFRKYATGELGLDAASVDAALAQLAKEPAA